ncbi:MAG: AAA family ATPase, partial [bacterium]|nr:AAA family ATPase [bacterium]
MENKKRPRQIPYGISDYELVRTGGYYYVDKTAYLETIKGAGRYLFFIRPRRFGKSLLLSMMAAYYDIANKERFGQLFENTAIYGTADAERNAYLILKFNFSTVDPAVEKVEDSFLDNIRVTILSFIRKYSAYLIRDPGDYLEVIKRSRSASDILFALKELCGISGRKIYALIDEYDNFANTILTGAGNSAYQTLTHDEGFFRSFFNVLKGGTDGPFSRLFLTGVSPVTLDDVTSGYNIGKNISLLPGFNTLLGFTNADVEGMLDYYRGEGVIEGDSSYLMDILRDWYGNYCFSEDAGTCLFNPDMVLYFTDHYLRSGKPPKNLIDRNARMDYGKLRHLILVDKSNKENLSKETRREESEGIGFTTNGNFTRLQEIIQKGEIDSDIIEGFPLERLAHRENFISLLFYFGLLTIKKEAVEPTLRIPNETARRLYYDYIKEAYEETSIFRLDLYTYNRLIKGMAMKGEWEPFFQFIAEQMGQSLS